jgi:hypothetical protein
MARINIVLRDKSGTDVATYEMDFAALPDIILDNTISYVLRRLSPRKDVAYFHEAVIYNMQMVT